MKMGLAPIRTTGACPIFMIEGDTFDMTDCPNSFAASKCG